MKLQYHIDKIFWTGADKLLYVIYGFVFLIQISLLSPDDLGLFGLLISINTWIFVISDSFSLQMIIQFGFNENLERKANLLAAVFHILIVMGISLLIMLSGDFFKYIFNEPRFIEITNILPILSLLMLPRTYFAKFLLKEHKISLIFLSDFFFLIPMSVFIVYFKMTNEPISLSNAVNIYFAGTALSSFITIVLSIKRVKIGFTGNLKLKDVFRFTVPFTLTNAIITFPRQLDTLILKLFFDLHSIGIYQAAKSLFRFFEEGVNGANSLIYPAAVRHFENKSINELHSIISKALSYLIIIYFVGSVILLSGLTDFAVKLLMKEIYISSVSYFNLLLISSVFIPFVILNFIITASGNHYALLKNVSISIVFSLIFMVIIGIMKIEVLMPAGYIVFFIVLAITNFNYMNKKLIKINFKELFRAIPDSRYFLGELFKKHL